MVVLDNNMGNQTRETNKRKRDETGDSWSVLLRCEWVDCSFDTDDRETLHKHVENHEAHLESRQNNGKTANWFCCMWDQCGFSCQGPKTVRFHINYHGYHTRLKALGLLLLKCQPQLGCHLDFSGRNILPELTSERTCEWANCDFRTHSFYRFLEHANTHVTGQPRRKYHQSVLCEWQQCKKIYKDMTKLKSHLRSHTQEKAIACPVCGVQFANKTKFIDHCSRQTLPENKHYQCSYCKKKFASERLLHDHIRLHVNLHKCPMCDMTCPYRSTLTLHIRYRHLSEKPFTCEFCQHKSTTEQDMKTHYQSHCSENYWVCEQGNCDFSCRSKNGLNAHYAKVHTDSHEEYGCHICDERFNRGASLTVHLKKTHSYRWASGQSRFRYIKDDAGVYRLQTVRYESMEVTEQVIANATERRPNRSKKFVCAAIAPDKLVITEDFDNNVDPDEPSVVDSYIGSESNSASDSESEFSEPICNNLDFILD